MKYEKRFAILHSAHKTYWIELYDPIQSPLAFMRDQDVEVGSIYLLGTCVCKGTETECHKYQADLPVHIAHVDGMRKDLRAVIERSHDHMLNVLLDVTEKQLALAYPNRHKCTDMNACWCPVCGDCTCGGDGDDEVESEEGKYDPSCPLHSATSSEHAAPPPPEAK